jgi:hypothetical protein
METLRQVVVFDAADLEAESAFWAGIFGWGHPSREAVAAFVAERLQTETAG